MTVVPSYGPEHVLGMDALLAMALCGAKARQVTRARAAVAAAVSGGGGQGDGDGQWRTDPHSGRRTLTIRSMETLGRVLGGGGGQG